MTIMSFLFSLFGPNVLCWVAVVLSLLPPPFQPHTRFVTYSIACFRCSFLFSPSCLLFSLVTFLKCVKSNRVAMRLNTCKRISVKYKKTSNYGVVRAKKINTLLLYERCVCMYNESRIWLLFSFFFN